MKTALCKFYLTPAQTPARWSISMHDPLSKLNPIRSKKNFEWIWKLLYWITWIGKLLAWRCQGTSWTSALIFRTKYLTPATWVAWFTAEQRHTHQGTRNPRIVLNGRSGLLICAVTRLLAGNFRCEPCRGLNRTSHITKILFYESIGL